MNKMFYLVVMTLVMQNYAMELENEPPLRNSVHKHIPSLWAFSARALPDPDQKPTYEKDKFGIGHLKDPYPSTAESLYTFIKSHADRLYGSVDKEPNNFDKIILDGLTFKRSTYHEHVYSFPSIDCLWIYLNYQIDPRGFDGDTFSQDFLKYYLEEPADIRSFLDHLKKEKSPTLYLYLTEKLAQKSLPKPHEEPCNREQENKEFLEYVVTESTPQQSLDEYFSKALSHGQIDLALQLYKNHNATISEEDAKKYRENFVSRGAFRLARLMDNVIDNHKKAKINDLEKNIKRLDELEKHLIEIHYNDKEFMSLLEQQLKMLQHQLTEK